MPNKRTLILLGIIILLMFSTGIFFSWWQQERSKSLIAETNYNSSIKELSSKAITVQLTVDQLREQKGDLIDSLNKLSTANIKANRLLDLARMQIVKERNNVKTEWRDTGSVREGKYVKIGRKLRFADQCSSFDVFYPTDSSYALISSLINIKADLAVYQGKRSREAKLFRWTVFRYGPRQTEAELFTSCGDSAKITLEHIRVLKK